MRASMKLGLDQAVLSTMRSQKEKKEGEADKFVALLHLSLLSLHVVFALACFTVLQFRSKKETWIICSSTAHTIYSTKTTRSLLPSVKRLASSFVFLCFFSKLCEYANTHVRFCRTSIKFCRSERRCGRPLRGLRSQEDPRFRKQRFNLLPLIHLSMSMLLTFGNACFLIPPYAPFLLLFSCIFPSLHFSYPENGSSAATVGDWRGFRLRRAAPEVLGHASRSCE